MYGVTEFMRITDSPYYLRYDYSYFIKVCSAHNDWNLNHIIAVITSPLRQFLSSCAKKSQIYCFCKRNRFVKIKLLSIFKTNVFELYVHRQVKTVYKLLKDKINIYLHLSETTLKTILGTILKNSIDNFSPGTKFSLFTTHIYIRYQFI